MSEAAVSAILVMEDDDKQLPVYYVSRSLIDVQTKYAYLENLILALEMLSIKLRPCIESHPIIVKPNYPIKTVSRNHN